ncbi:tumor necrosis factor receptor superfamily member 6 isoform X2 [Hyperolius riggenbachi]|uniref:tumor necrosis factor receptor superfamily member 6 isoform X2 n=1 Tax=Hyperolius riggenbachi TaxID=752182 RepID=UPI0035A2D587
MENSGTYVTSHCDVAGGDSVCANCTEGRDYTEHPSGVDKCIKCENCDSRAGLELLYNCTVTQNTKCSCRQGFFCTSPLVDGDCSRCHQCTECQFGYFERCSGSKDSDCVSEFRSHVWMIVAFGGLAIVGIVMGLLHWKEKRRKKSKIPQGPIKVGLLVQPPTSGGPISTAVLPGDPAYPAALPSDPDPPPRPTLPEHLQDLNLDNLLNDMASKMEMDEVLRVARRTLNLAGVEETRGVYRDNPTEVKYQLLYKWYTENGRKGAFSFLFEQCSNLTRENLLKLVRQEQTGL